MDEIDLYGDDGTDIASISLPAAQTAEVKQKELSQPPPNVTTASKGIYLEGLHWWTSDLDILTHLANAGLENEVVPAQLGFQEHRSTGKSKGVCFVLFKTPIAAEAAKRYLETIEFDEAKPKVRLAAEHIISNPFRASADHRMPTKPNFYPPSQVQSTDRGWVDSKKRDISRLDQQQTQSTQNEAAARNGSEDISTRDISPSIIDASSVQDEAKRNDLRSTIERRKSKDYNSNTESHSRNPSASNSDGKKEKRREASTDRKISSHARDASRDRGKDRHRSPDRARDRGSKVSDKRRDRSRSTERRRDKSSERRRRNRSSERKRNRSPERRRDRSSDRKRDRSSDRKRDRSSERRRDRSTERRRDRSGRDRDSGKRKERSSRDKSLDRDWKRDRSSERVSNDDRVLKVDKKSRVPTPLVVDTKTSNFESFPSPEQRDPHDIDSGWISPSPLTADSDDRDRDRKRQRF
ncbi:hypothetical protein BC833DRAFT_587234 [Globomyces pollinis-pini]|nr:hypothetical protein BC833DRAFT_587234 [Globomyces pollinis-pini]